LLCKNVKILIHIQIISVKEFTKRLMLDNYRKISALTLLLKRIYLYLRIVKIINNRIYKKF